jgi:hypothetical protein
MLRTEARAATTQNLRLLRTAERIAAKTFGGHWVATTTPAAPEAVSAR